VTQTRKDETTRQHRDKVLSFKAAMDAMESDRAEIETLEGRRRTIDQGLRKLLEAA